MARPEWHVVTMDEYASGPYATKAEAMAAHHFDGSRRTASGVYAVVAEGATRSTTYYIGTEATLRADGFGWIFDQEELP